MWHPEQPGYPYRTFSSHVVLLEMFRVGKQASTLYGSEDWELVCEILTGETRRGTAQGLRALATVATAMAESLEEDGGPNYGLQR